MSKATVAKEATYAITVRGIPEPTRSGMDKVAAKNRRTLQAECILAFEERIAKELGE